MPVRVSLSMIVKNEEANLPACLRCAAGLFDEMVVVDTGSTDRTKEIAAGFGARVFDFPWVDDFAAARNESLRHVTGDWVFWLDADDRVDEPNRARLRGLFAGLTDENAAYAMRCLCLSHGGGGATHTVHLRLFRNDRRIRWQYRAHEQIRPAVERLGGEVRWSDAVVVHVGYQDGALLRRKQERNVRLLQLDLKEYPDDPYLLYHVGRNQIAAGQAAAGLPLLRRCLKRAAPKDFFLRPLFGQLARGHHQLGQRVEALAVCRLGQTRFADDAELLFMESILLTEMGDLPGAESCLLMLLQPGARYSCVDVDLCGPKARHNLAQLYRRQKRDADAEAQWRALLAERPDFTVAWLTLADLYLSQGRLPELDQTARRLAADPRRAAEAAVLRAKLLLARKETAEARRVLEEAVPLAPRSVYLRMTLVQVLGQLDPDGPSLEKALNDLLTLDPGNTGARASLAALRQRASGRRSVGDNDGGGRETP